MQLSKHIGTAAWSTADKMLYALIAAAFILPQKVIGEHNWGVYTPAQAILTIIFMLSDGLSLQAMVNFGMDESRRSQALTVSGVVHFLFISLCTALIYFGRGWLAAVLNEPELVPVLELFPLVSLGFLLRNYFLKVSQLHIDTRATFMIDAAWIGSIVLLILYGWLRGTLATAEDMMIISAVSSSISSLAGLLLYGRKLRFTMSIDRAYAVRMLQFGSAQVFSAATLALQSQGDVILLKKFVSSSVVGNYDAAKKFFRGFEAMRDAGSLFVYPAIARLKSQGRDEEMVLLVEKMIGFMLILIVPIVALIWFGPTEHIFDLIYRGKYQNLADVFKIMSLAALAIPFSMNMNVLNGLGEARTLFRVTLGSAIFFFLAVLLLVPPFGVSGMGMAIVVSYASLGFLSTRAVASHVPFTVMGAFGRWRDAFEFVLRVWRKRVARTRVRRVKRRPGRKP